MKRVLGVCVLGTAVGMGCVTNTTTPEPPTPPSGPPDRWSGTAVYTYHLDTDVGGQTETFNVTVTWTKDTSPNPAPPAGGARYVVTGGGIHLTYRGNGDIGRCTEQAEGDYPLPPANPTVDPEGEILVLGADGRYQGQLYADISQQYVQECANGSFIVRSQMTLELDISGSLDGGRMHGEMTPRVLQGNAATSTRSGSWDFAAN